MTRIRQTKQQKAEYDRKRKAEGRKERRLTKPLKLFFKNKYNALYDEFMEFYNQMDNKYPEKKDLTKTEMFKDFLKPYSAVNNPIENIVVETSTETTSVVETSTANNLLYEYMSTANNPVETSTLTPSKPPQLNIPAVNNPIETSTVNPVETSTLTPSKPPQLNIPAVNNPIETSTVNPVETSTLTPSKPPQLNIPAVNNPIETSTVNPVETSTLTPSKPPQLNIPAVNNPIETSTVNPVETSTLTPSKPPQLNMPAVNNPVETSTTNNLLFDVIESLFGPGGIDEYVDHMNNIDEGIDINTLDELKLDYEDFNFELECMEF